VLTGGDNDAYVPGLNDHLWGNEKMSIISTDQKIKNGRYAKEMLTSFKQARHDKDTAKITELSALFKDKEFNDKYFKYFGYSSIDKPEEVVPNVGWSFYSFHLMVILGFFFILVFSLALIFLFKGTLVNNKWFLWIALLSIPLPYVAGELGWIVAEVGRQPWIIQNLLTVKNAVTQVTTGSVITTFILFAILFTALLAAEISIMLKQIKTGANQH
jgi:cytochrome bd ubiquinol oxidase subunit I